MIYGYARCSTNEKEQDINRQVRELKQYRVNFFSILKRKLKGVIKRG